MMSIIVFMYCKCHGIPLMCIMMVACLFIQKAKGGAMLEGIVKVAKMLNSRPHSWMDCVALARVKFEKYFNHRVCALGQVTMATWLSGIY